MIIIIAKLTVNLNLANMVRFKNRYFLCEIQTDQDMQVSQLDIWAVR